MLLHTQFTIRDRVPGLEGCYLIRGTFPIGNLIPGPRNLVFADRFFSILESLGFFVLTWFSPFKNKNKSKWRLQSKTVPPLGRIFQNSKINPHFLFTFFLPFKSESRRSVDRVGSTGLLIKYWWCLTSTLWAPSTSSSSTNHLYGLNGKFNFNSVSLRHKHRPRHYLYT